MMELYGNIELMNLTKTAFLCSQKIKAEVVIKSYDWAKKQRRLSNCIICGNHSQIEKDVFEILLKGEQPLILVLARGLKIRWEQEVIKAVEQNRLLIISPFTKETKRITRETAVIKNKTILDLADKIMIAYASSGGQLEKLLRGKVFELI